MRHLVARLLLHKLRRAGVLPTPEAARQRTHEGIFERIPEIPIEVCVDKRVQRRIEVPDPEQHAHDYFGRLAGFAAHVCCYIPVGLQKKFKTRSFEEKS